MNRGEWVSGLGYPLSENPADRESAELRAGKMEPRTAGVRPASLVERLRNIYCARVEPGERAHIKEAADRIEALESALRDLLQVPALNMDELDEADVLAYRNAEAALAEAEGRQP